MTQIFARQALTANGWAENVRIAVDHGRITSLQADSRAQDDDFVAGSVVWSPVGRHDFVAGIVSPGLANAHSHAFQRILAGHTEQRGPAGKDNFWTWRTRMYALAGHIDARAMLAIARQVYGEMLATGYTSVAEFHYLHNEPGESSASEAMFEAIVEAASDSGIRLTYVPVLYERAGFSDPKPSDDQKRFALQVDQLIAHYERASTLSKSNSEG